MDKHKTMETLKRKIRYEKRYSHIAKTVVLILVIGVALFWYTTFIQQTTMEQCFRLLDESREQIGEQINNEMSNEQEKLEAASYLLEDLLLDYEANRELILQIMNASTQKDAFSHWEICFPNGQVVRNDGSTLKLSEKYSFEDRISKDIVVSERRTALEDGTTQILMISKSIFHGGTCIGILSSILDLEQFSEIFFSGAYYQKSELVLFERTTGDILIDSWNGRLGNIQWLEKQKAVDGYRWEEVEQSYQSGQEGHAAFLSERAGEKMYLSYAPVPYSDWEVLVFAPDSVCMESANIHQKATYRVIFVILLAFLLFFAAIFIEEQHRYRIREEREAALQEALQKAEQANAAKSEFLSRMSHDIRTPLNGILGFFDLIEQHQASDELLRRNCKKAKTAAEQLLALIHEILMMSKLEQHRVELEHEVFDLRVLAREILDVAEIQAEREGIRITHEDCAMKIAHPYVYGSPLHVKEIFLNILSNAIKYNKPGGAIAARIRTGKREGNRIFYHCSIVDTGIGMHPKFLEHMFDAFTQEKVDARSVYQGTGLGMSIAKLLVDQMGGEIRVKSTQGVGSEFLVSLPFEIASPEEAKPPMLHAGSEEESIVGVRILLAEDNALNLEIATELLEAQGAEVTPVTNGAEAVERFQTMPPGSFDILLMDIRMPVLDGIAATKAIRALDRKDAASIPIVAVTADAFFEDIHRCNAAGMNAHLAKPMDMTRVKGTIFYLVRQKNPGQNW